MTNDEIRNLRAGDEVATVFNGRTQRVTITAINYVVRCSNERSGSFGHWAAGIEWATGTGNGWISGSVYSDEYLAGDGYGTTHQDGVRLRGSDLVHKATDEESREAASKSSDARR